MNVMVVNLGAIAERESRAVQAEESEPDLLLFQLLQELIFYKDAERLLLRVRGLRIERAPGGYRLAADLAGEGIDADRHELNVDVKAVTLHRFRVETKEGGWKATVILDV
jgi:SHS2 domain-containing protein